MLPLDFRRELEALELAYLAHEDAIRQSGFGGGPERWRAERSPILEAIASSGSILDVGCANGFLLESLVAWARERRIELEPYGVDLGPRLIEVARGRLPAATFWVAEASTWTPPRRFRYVYALHDCVPDAELESFARHLLTMVEPGGRLILGAYGSRSRGTAPFDLPGELRRAGFVVAGEAWGGDPPITRFAWLDRAP